MPSSSPSPDLSGLTALITGASSGIGEATARSFARLGADVALVARREDRLSEVVTSIEAIDGHHAKVLPVVADISDQGQATDGVKYAVDTLGRLDIVVNNAGVMLLDPVLGARLDDWDRMLGTNVQGMLYVTHAALPHLIEAAAGDPRRVADIVNVSSVAGRQARAGAAVYNLTKFGLTAFSEALRQEVAERHVRVGLIEPGPVDTELVTHLSDAARKRAASRLQQIEQLVAQDIADAIAYMVTQPRRSAVGELLVRPTESIL